MYLKKMTNKKVPNLENCINLIIKFILEVGLNINLSVNVEWNVSIFRLTSLQKTKQILITKSKLEENEM